MRFGVERRKNKGPTAMAAPFNPNRLTPYVFLAPAAVVLAAGLLYPIGYMLYASFLRWSPNQRIQQASGSGWATT